MIGGSALLQLKGWGIKWDFMIVHGCKVQLLNKIANQTTTRLFPRIQPKKNPFASLIHAPIEKVNISSCPSSSFCDLLFTLQFQELYSRLTIL